MLRLATLAALSAAVAASGAHSKNWINKFDPKPNPEAVVTHGGARFTVLFDGVVRMEYSATRTFDNEATLAFIHRNTPKPAFDSRVKGSVLTIRTSHFELTYDASPSKGTFFNEANLKVTGLVEPFKTWAPGSEPTGNLHGTIRTLDRVGHAVDLKCQAPTTAMIYYTHCEEGLASRDGWVVYDDSVRPRFDSSVPDWTWLKTPPPAALKGDGAYMDMYYFGNGLNHTTNLGQYVKLGGPIPLMPRYALGPQFSRWYAYGEIDSLVNVQSGFAAHGIPLDVYVIDMDWHYTYDRGLQNPFGVQVEPWTGYTTYPGLYPELQHFLGYLKRRGVAVTFNMHPAAGVQFHEANYPAMARDMGVDPATGATVAFDVANVSYHRALFKNMLKPLDDAGLQFWWIDFQQGPFSKVPYLNPTITLNYAYWTNPYRFGQLTEPVSRGRDRPYLMGRWGGMGGHRYPIGFVGDTYSKWNVLRYETYFMPTASNVAFQWTHDIGGFAGRPEPEMFTRWVQFGVFSPTLRSHSHKSSPPRAIWTIPNPHFSIMRHFYRLRTRLVPYIATAQRLAYDTGVQVVRPMYYAHSGLDSAYSLTAQHQYYFGPDMWTAPIASPASNSSLQFGNLTTWTFWMPPGSWVEHTSGELFKVGAKGAFVSRNFSLWEMPLYSAPGTIVPQRTLPTGTEAQGVLGLSSQVPEDLTIVVLPGVSVEPGATATRSTQHYDDDGASVDYEDGAFHWTTIGCTWAQAAAATGSDTLSCTVSAPTGAGFPAFPAARKYSFRFPGTWAPASVTFAAGSGGSAAPVAFDAFSHPDPLGEDASWARNVHTWSYEGQTLSTWVRLDAPVPTGSAFTITLTFPPGARVDDPLLTSGFARKVQRALGCKMDFNEHYGVVFPSDIEMLLNVTGAPHRLEAAAARALAASAPPDAEHARKLLQGTRRNFKTALQFMGGWRVPANMSFTGAWQRCVGASHDALASLVEVPEPSEEVEFRKYEQVMNEVESGYYGMGGEGSGGAAEAM